MAHIDRRTFLKHTTLVAAGGVALGPMQALTALAAPPGGRRAPLDNAGYGPLMPVRDKTTGESLLLLPRGFQYRSFSLSGEVLSDGNVVPPRHDGMAAFPWEGGRVRLIRNHEVFFDPGAIVEDDTAYDFHTGGGTTTLEISPHAEHIESWLSLNGTSTNCAGGPTPWGSWITCEETVNGPDANRNFLGQTMDLDEQHGYLFEVPVSRGPGERELAEPIRSAGRFTHEAVAVDPRTGIVYQTQDDFGNPSGLWRYIPPSNPFETGRLDDGGTLEVLAIGPGTVELHENQTVGVTYDVHWIEIEDPDPTFPTGISDGDAAGWLMREEAIPKGAAIFSRLEGCWFGVGKLFFNSTFGGGPFVDQSGFGSGFGQTWMYDPMREQLTLIFESPDPEVLENPDNITVSPRGNLLLCEDSAGFNFLRGLTVDGEIFDFCRNNIPGQLSDEFAGATFAPGGETLFVNVQGSPHSWSFAIWGPWQRGPL